MWSSIDTDMLLLLGKYLRSGICWSIFWYREANNAYIKDYDWNKESTDLTFWDRNSLYECVKTYAACILRTKTLYMGTFN